MTDRSAFPPDILQTARAVGSLVYDLDTIELAQPLE
jgi:hypothetical protein